MDNLKPFDPKDIDESLLRLVSYGGVHYVLFPYVDVTGAAPEFRSVRRRIDGEQLTRLDLAEMAAAVKRHGAAAEWFIQFSTPWLIGAALATEIRERSQTSMRER
jgi:hypothetical protein